MKKTTWSVLIILIMVFTASHVWAQESVKSSADKKKLTKSEKKKLKEEAEKADWEKYNQLIESRQFVFQATDIYTSSGTAPLDQKTNFFYVIGDDAVIQLTFMGLQSVPTSNGLGGITSEGKVTKFNLKADNFKKPIRVTITVKPLAGQGGGIHQLNLTIFGDGYAELLLSRNNTRLKGIVIPADEAKIHQGSTR
ncbi:MAG TPA: DUF4251 domain-containing protein [Bacteroidetes bacterium]|nr:MAG: hypothetical protein DRI72_01695 [Bacteroidota bacterium]RLD88020.1 MAG: hypothetical protein DRJ02_04985 [Bacteroidota bacterium]HHL57576.1 DUF4251 domain-containing protein [Bacteroidota bacterium]